MKTVVIIQARMGSTRLPGKVTKLLAGRPMLEHVIRRALLSGVDEVCVATTTLDRDDELVSLARSCGASTFRGSETDVLARFCGAARERAADLIVRVSSDCPLYDPEVLREMLAVRSRMSPPPDYFATGPTGRTFPHGLDTEIVPAEVLYRVEGEADDPRAREHVTWHLYNHPESYTQGLHRESGGRDRSGYRWTVDTPEDYAFASAVYAALDPEQSGRVFGREEVFELLTLRPDLTAINTHIQQLRP